MVQAATAGARPPPEMTLEEWAELDEDEEGELCDGRLVEEEVPSFLHEAIVAWLIGALRAWALPRGGWVFGSEAKFAVGPRRGRKPDVSVFLAGSPLPDRRSSLSRTPPGIMIEVITARPRDARRDRVEKLRDYALFGVGSYWLVDPRQRTLEVLHLASGGCYSIELAAGDGMHPIPGCEGLTIDLDALWAEVDRLPEGAGDAVPEDDGL